MAKAKAKAKTESRDFEQSLERLETIIGEMEDGKLNLDQMIAHFEEGTKLVTSCTAKLTEVEKKIEALVSKNDPDATEPLDPEDDLEDDDDGDNEEKDTPSQDEIPF